MPPPRLDLGLLKPHNWDRVLAAAWADKKKHSEQQWKQHATKAVHRAISARQEIFLQMVLAPLDYGWCRCIDGQIVVVQAWQAKDYDYDIDGYNCTDLADPPEEDELPVPINCLEWPISWMDWEFAKSVLEYGESIGRYSQGHTNNLLFWALQCYEYYPNRWADQLGDFLCAALYDFPAFPDGEAIAAYRTKHMEKPAPPQANMLALLAAMDQGDQCPTSISHPKSKPSSPSQTSSKSSISQAAKTASASSTPSTSARQLTIYDLP